MDRRFQHNSMGISTHDLARRSTRNDTTVTDGQNISTHDLARRATHAALEYAQKVKHISTHDLARRSTVPGQNATETTAFQLTTSQGGRRYHYSLREMLNTFQLTTSQGGRRRVLRLNAARCHFNSRPRKEVDSNFYAKSFPFKITFCAHCI